MYALCIVRYRRPLDEVLPFVDAHRGYLRTLQERGILLVSGPFQPRTGGALLLRLPDDDVNRTLDAIRDADPFIQQGLAQYEILPWAPNIGVEKMDAL